MNKWQTQASYAKDRGLNRSSVARAVQSGRIEWNGKRGRACRVRGDLAEPLDNRVPASGGDESLQQVKLEKLRADVELQRQRINGNRDAMRREFAEAVIEEYWKAFAPLKVRLTEMRLDASKLATLRKLIDGCAASFETALRGRLAPDE